MSKNNFYHAMIDWLDVWCVDVVDLERIKEITADEDDDSPFQLRINMGSDEDQPDRGQSGFSLCIFDSNRKSDDKPLLAIRIPWDTGKKIAAFINHLPANDLDT